MPTKKLKKELRKKYESTPKITLDEWEEAMIADHSYDDIDYLNQANREVQKKIDYWNNYNATSWLGKWYKQIQLDRLKRKLFHYKDKCTTK
jgi:hypothetical protein